MEDRKLKCYPFRKMYYTMTNTSSLPVFTQNTSQLFYVTLCTSNIPRISDSVGLSCNEKYSNVLKKRIEIYITNQVLRNLRYCATVPLRIGIIPETHITSCILSCHYQAPFYRPVTFPGAV